MNLSLSRAVLVWCRQRGQLPSFPPSEAEQSWRFISPKLSYWAERSNLVLTLALAGTSLWDILPTLKDVPVERLFSPLTILLSFGFVFGNIYGCCMRRVLDESLLSIWGGRTGRENARYHLFLCLLALTAAYFMQGCLHACCVWLWRSLALDAVFLFAYACVYARSWRAHLSACLSNCSLHEAAHILGRP
jgi:hypothetical protein